MALTALQTKVTAVTRYTDCDAEFTFLGVFSSGQVAHQEISKNIELFGKYAYRKDVGNWEYNLKVTPNEVTMETPVVKGKGRVSVRYRLTEVTLDELVHTSEF